MTNSLLNHILFCKHLKDFNTFISSISYIQVHVKWPPYILATEEFITAQISGLYTSEEIAQGNVTLTLSGRKWKLNETFSILWTEKVFIVSQTVIS